MHVITFREIISGMSPSTLLALKPRLDCESSIDEQVPEFKRLHEVLIPHTRLILHHNVAKSLVDVCDLFHTFCQHRSITVHGCMLLHGLLHLSPENCCGDIPLIVQDPVHLSNGLLSGTGFELGLTCALAQQIEDDGVGAGPAEDNNVQQRVSTKAVSSMDTSTRRLSSSKQTRDNGIHVAVLGVYHLTSPQSRDTPHVVVHSGTDGNRLLSKVHAGKGLRALDDTRKALVKHVTGQVVQLQQDMILLGSDTTASHDFESHGPRNDVTRGQVLCSRGVPLHKPFSFAVHQESSFTTSPFCD
mmetsp:Transcript_7538/g.13317  ORF Transcript_7538/g.13317 Transcript_7538/m.13317 type:complete len:301 (-) Transcript_7538:841-1743(-)